MKTPIRILQNRRLLRRQGFSTAQSESQLKPAALLFGLLLSLSACTATTPVSDTGLTLSEEPLPGKFVWHDLMTDDPVAAQQFYHELFGWTFEKTVGIGEGDYTLIRNHGRLLGGMVTVADPAGEDYSRWLPYLSVIDVDHGVVQTTAAGGRTAVAPRDISNIARAAAVVDPQGAVIGLVRSGGGDPADSQQLALGDIVWNEMLAADAQEARRYYQQLVSFQTATMEEGDKVHILLKTGSRNRGSIMTRPNESITPLWITHFAVADVSASAKRAAELGGNIVLAANADIREGRFALVTDPTGAVLALHQWAN